MIPTTPRGFRDVLPTEAAWRQEVTRAVCDTFASWGYVPVETPALERLEVLERAGALSDTPFRFFDSDNNLLALRPDCTLPVARLAALRLAGKPGPFRLCYAQEVFREHGSLYGDDRAFGQMGVEFIGADGVMADAEVICLLFDALAASGIEGFTVALGTVSVLNALVAASGANEAWKEGVFRAFHNSDFVEVRRLAEAPEVAGEYGSAVAELLRIRGGVDAIERCRALVAPLGCDVGLDELRCVYELVCANEEQGRLLIDFSVISSFDYYTGMVFKAYAPQVGHSVATGGRYDTTLEAFGRKGSAAGFAIGLERVMQVLEVQGTCPPQVGPQETVYGTDAAEVFARAAELRRSGKRVAIGGVR